jgi:hypothetical protein
LYLGLPVIGVPSPGNTAYFSSSVFTATAGQTVFTPSGTYQVGFLNVIRNGSQLAPADYTATNGTTVTLASPCTAGDTVVIEVFNLTSLTDALPLTGGTLTGSLKNSAGNRSYPFTYAISAANTWEQKTVTIAGDTSGTWLTTNGIGITACFDLGSGTDYTGTAGAWAAENNFGADGAVKLISTLNATWQITGVQLERGSNATSFEFRDYGRELAMCQRYFQKFTGSQLVLFGYWDGTNSAVLSMPYPVTPRTSPTGLAVSSASHFLVNNSTVGNPTASAIIFNSASLYAMQLEAQVASGGSSNGKACRLISASSSASIEITGFEL